MSNVPTITPGPDDTENTPEGATPNDSSDYKHMPISRTDARTMRPRFPDGEAYAKLSGAKRAERATQKADSTRYLLPASWAPSRSLPLSPNPGYQCAATGL